MPSLKDTMRAVLWSGVPYNVTVQDVPVPSIQRPTDALIRVTASAICGTDLHIYHGIYGSTNPPWVMGHECMGIVEEVGSGVDFLQTGDHVVIPDIGDLGHLNLNLGEQANKFGSSVGLGPDFGDYYGCQGMYLLLFGVNQYIGHNRLIQLIRSASQRNIWWSPMPTKV
jgi:threonine dehydrogenase-like Zn-dependent dehydrogenase